MACGRQPADEITVSAAANLIPAFTEIGQAFEAETGIIVVYNFGSSGKLAQQIEQGAPVDVFASANADYVTRLVESGFIEPQSERIYALGRLVMWSRDPDLAPKTLADLTASRIERIAIANPQHAPYGAVAKTVLQGRQLWDVLQPKLIVADDVRQTLTYAETGDVSVALAPLSLVIRLETGAYTMIPASTHPPITQAIGILRDGPRQKAAQLFVDFVLTEKGQVILEKYGYESVK